MLPDTIVYVRVALPAAFVTVTVTGYDPAAGVVPVMIPVLAASVSPAGSPGRGKRQRACPLAGIANSSGASPARPNVNGACSRGVAGGAVIEMVIVVCAYAVPQSNRATASAVARVRIREGLRETASFISGKCRAIRRPWLRKRAGRRAPLVDLSFDWR